MTCERLRLRNPLKTSVSQGLCWLREGKMAAVRYPNSWTNKFRRGAVITNEKMEDMKAHGEYIYIYTHIYIYYMHMYYNYDK